jgi:hypothetical protein
VVCSCDGLLVIVIIIVVIIVAVVIIPIVINIVVIGRLWRILNIRGIRAVTRARGFT